MREVVAGSVDVTGIVPVQSPGPEAIFGHVARTGHGRLWVDRPVDPVVALAETGGNLVLRGQADRVDAEALQPLVVGFLDCAPEFDGVVEEAFPGHAMWPRVVHVLTADPPRPARTAVPVRRLAPGDEHAMRALSAESAWISKTRGGPGGLARSGLAWGAFAADRLVAIAGVFFSGDRHDEVGVATEPGRRGAGLATACAHAVCAHSLATGRVPTWTTSPDNAGSLRVAANLGFSVLRTDHLHVIGQEIPGP